MKPLSMTTDHVRRLAVLAAMVVVAATAGCRSLASYKADRHVIRGETLMGQQDLEAALAEFQAAAELDSESASAHSNMGVIYRRMGEYQQAIECFVEAIRRNPCPATARPTLTLSIDRQTSLVNNGMRR